MSFPLNAFADWTRDGTLLISLLVGVGFGFALERGGFGSSKILSGIFYFKDWRVLKVMFTAIVTAMLGLYLVDGAGLLVMDEVAFRSTYLYAQVVGGLILGVGFVVAGYCPGTSIVGAVSGRLDAIVCLAGVVLGIGVFEESYAWLKDFYLAGYMGEVSIAQWSGIPQGVVVLAVVLVALGAFWATERFGPNGRLRPDTEASARRLPGLVRGAGLAMGAGALVAVVQLAGPGQTRPISEVRADEVAAGLQPGVDALDLAAWLVEGRDDVLVLDVRAATDDAAVTLPGALALEPEVLVDFRRRPALGPDRVLVVVDEAGAEPATRVVGALRAAGLDAKRLDGGAAAWRDDVLAETALDPRAAALRLLVSGQSAFEGAAPPPPPKPGAAPLPRKKKKGGGC